MAKKKEGSLKWVFSHNICYLVTGMVIAAPVISGEIALVVSIVAVLHTLFDVIAYGYISIMKKRYLMTRMIDRNIFFISQALHLTCLVMVSYLFTINDGTVLINRMIAQFFDTLGISEMRLATWLIALLVVHKPANTAISKLLLIYKQEGCGTDSNAGSFIGTVERIIILIFLATKQYSAIGLVLTAKSIARYDKISKDRDFAEYYLLGTLLSTMIVIVVSFIL
jgi:hypothetical protein